MLDAWRVMFILLSFSWGAYRAHMNLSMVSPIVSGAIPPNQIRSEGDSVICHDWPP